MFYNVFWFGLWVWLMVWLIFGLYLAYNWLMEFPAPFAIILFSLKPRGKHELHIAPIPRKPQNGIPRPRTEEYAQETPGSTKGVLEASGPKVAPGSVRRPQKGFPKHGGQHGSQENTKWFTKWHPEAWGPNVGPGHSRGPQKGFPKHRSQKWHTP